MSPFVNSRRHVPVCIRHGTEKPSAKSFIGTPEIDKIASYFRRSQPKICTLIKMLCIDAYAVLEKKTFK